MKHYRYTPPASNITDSAVSDLKKRITVMICMSTLVVAAAFGVSFYFAFISSGSAIAQQIPQLSQVVEKLKSQLLFNTFGLVAVIIASIFILNRLIVRRIFGNIGRIGKSLNEIAEGKLPERGGIDPEAGFEEISSACNFMLSKLRQKEAEELKQLERCLEISGAGSNKELQVILKSMISSKKKSLEGGEPSDKREKNSQNEKNDGVFLQPS